jgi:putative flavoprotein involved in K+ transport
VRTDAGEIEAGAVIVATGANQVQRVPDFAADLGNGVLQIASDQYRTPDQLRPGGVLVVGAGTSGAEIAIEAAQHGHRTWLSGPSTGRVPAVAYTGNGRPFWWFATHVLTVGTPIGRKMRAKMLTSGAPLINLHLRDIVNAGVTRVSRTVGVRDGMPVIEGGEALDVTNVVWCTGYRHDFGWIDLPLPQDHGMPAHERGAIPSAPGLYFLGLPFLTGFTSSLLGGVGRDAEAIVECISARAAAPSAG